MKALPLEEILHAIEGTVICGNPHQDIHHAAYRMRDLKERSLYFAFAQPRDWTILQKMSATIVTEDRSLQSSDMDNITIVWVENLQEAFRKFVQYYRSLFTLPVIGVTGTCGKTTTTEMIKWIISAHFKISATAHGVNAIAQNLSYLMEIDEHTEAAVYEIGVTNPGNIRRSCYYFQPQIGIILNIGVYHLLGCKTLKEYIEAKAELLDGMGQNGTLILNAEDENISQIDLSLFNGKLLYFGGSEKCDYRAGEIRETRKGIVFHLYHLHRKYTVFVPCFGKHNVYNALAAIAASHTVGISLEEAIRLLSKFPALRRHLQFRSGPNGCTMIDDTWNCTPLSMKAALTVLDAKVQGKKKIAVLGYMPQLGEAGSHEYVSIGEMVASLKVDALIVIGEEARPMGLRAIELGMNPRQVYFCETGESVYRALRPYLHPQSLILLKFPYQFRLRKVSSFQKLMRWLFPRRS